MNSYRIRNLSLKVLSTLILFCFSSLLWANDTDTRLFNVERITQSHTQLIQELQNQINDMNQDIDTLRGEVQVLQYQLQQSVSRQKEILLQLDKDSTKEAASPATPQPEASVSSTSDKTNSAHADSADVIDNHTSLPSAAQPTELENPLQQLKSNPLLTEKGFNFTGDDQKDYNAIIALILMDKNYYPKGIVALQEFVKRYPNSRYLANAYYWIGQLNYATGEKEQAIYYFATVVKDYPTSEKTQDAMYKVALLLQDKGQLNNAKAIYQQILKLYPSAPIAAQAKKQLDFLSKQ